MSIESAHKHVRICPARGGGCDKMRWRLNGNGMFDVRFYYVKIQGTNALSFPWKSIWCVKAPRRVSLAWTTAWGKILTHDNLMKRGFSLVCWCCMCQCSEETVDRLLLHCDVAFALWSVVFGAFGTQWVSLEIVAAILFRWQNWFGKHSSDI